MKKALRRLHLRWYHATIAQMTRLLSLVGVPQDVMKLIAEVVDTCRICRTWARGAPHVRTATRISLRFNQALQDRNKRGHYAEITFIGLNSINIKEHKKVNSFLQVTVDFVAEVITCIRDKEKKIISGDPEKIKKIYDTWVFSRDIRSSNPNWQLVDTLT